jgi:hypothetical protein
MNANELWLYMFALVIILSKILAMCLIRLAFQMVGPTRNSPNGFRATGSSDLPPLSSMTPSEAFMATQTKVLHQILQTQQ